MTQLSKKGEAYSSIFDRYNWIFLGKMSLALGYCRLTSRQPAIHTDLFWNCEFRGRF